MSALAVAEVLAKQRKRGIIILKKYNLADASHGQFLC